MGLDVGTTGCKAAVFSQEGQMLSYSYREYPLLHPREGWSELDSIKLWHSIEQVVRDAALKANEDPVTAVSVSVQGEAVVPVDKKGEPLNNFVVTFDDRTIAQARWWEERMGRKRIFKITGMPLHPMYSICKIQWFRKNMPGLYRKAWKFLCVQDFVFLKLGLPPTIDFSLAARTMAFDVLNERWSEEILSAAGVDEALLAEVKPSGSIVGEIPADRADELGLAKKAVAVTGGHDQCCGLLGAGAVKESSAMNATGTSDVLNPVLGRPLLSEGMLKNNYCCYHHTKPGMFTSCAFNLTGGLLLRWYRDTLCDLEMREAQKTGRDVYELIVGRACKSPASVFFLPHFVGSGTPTLDPRSRGALVGLTLSTTKSDISRAVLDSTNYEMKLNIDSMENVGIRIDEIRAVGGGAKSRKWLQMKADVFGKTVISLEVSEAACLGAAILAGAASGVFRSVDEGVSRTVRVKDTYRPAPSMKRQYLERYELYKKLYPTLKRLFS